MTPLKSALPLSRSPTRTSKTTREGGEEKKKKRDSNCKGNPESCGHRRRSRQQTNISLVPNLSAGHALSLASSLHLLENSSDNCENFKADQQSQLSKRKQLKPLSNERR